MPNIAMLYILALTNIFSLFLNPILCALKYFTKGFSIDSPSLMEFLHLISYVASALEGWFELSFWSSLSNHSLQTQGADLIFKIQSFSLPHLEADLRRQG